MRTIFLALVIQCYISITFEQAFEITRPSHGRDEFNIPVSMCSRNGTDSGRGCKSFYAVDGVHKCSCLCPARNATFAFYNKGWSCVENRKIRRYLDRGCEFTSTFKVQTADRRLPALAFGARRQISLWFLFWIYWRCSLDIHNSWFMGCWGSKQFLRHYSASVNLFKITRRNPSAPYFLKVNSNIRNTDIFRGKIINLILNCRMSEMGQTFRTRNCLLFKFQGNTNCPVTKPAATVSSIIHPLGTSSTVSSTSTITASQVFTNATAFLGSTSVPFLSITSHNFTIPSIISDAAPTASYSHTTVSTYFGTQLTITEIPTTTSATQPTVTEISPRASSSQPAVPKISTYLATQPTFSEISPTASASELTVFEVSPTTLIAQPTIIEISSKASTSQLSISKVSTFLRTQSTFSDISPTASASELTVSGVLTTKLVTQPTVTEISPTASTSQPVISKVSTYLGTKPTFSEISPPASASGVLTKTLVTQPIVSENSPSAIQWTVTATTSTASFSQPTISEVLPTSSTPQPTVTEISPTIPVTQQTVTEITPTTSSTQPTASEILPTAFETQLTVSEMSPTAPTTSQSTVVEFLPRTQDTRPTFSKISPRAPHTQPSVSEVSPTVLNWRPPRSEISPNVPVTQAIGPGILPTTSDALPAVSEILPTEPDIQPTTSEISPTEPDTQPAVSETSPRDPDTSQEPSILQPKKLENDSTTLTSNVPPTLSQDREGKTDKDSSASLGLIAGVPVAIIIIVAIVVCLVYRRRHSNKRNRSSSGTVSEITMDTLVMSPQINQALQPDDEKTYYTLEFKDPPTFEIPGYDVPDSIIHSSVKEEDVKSPLYALSRIVQPQPGNKQGPIHHGLEEPVRKNKPTTDHVLKDNEQEPNNNCSNKDPLYYVLEGPYPESTEGIGHSDANALKEPEEPIYCSLDEVYPVSSGTPCPDTSSEDESIYNVLERRYFHGSKVPAHYVQISSNGPIFNPSEKPHSDSSKNNTSDTESTDEPLYDVLERRYFDGSKVSAHYIQMSPNGPIFKPLYSILEDRFLKGSEVPEHYVQISPNEHNTLDKLKRDSIKESSNGHLDSRKESSNVPETVGNIVEEHYLEGSEVPENYEQVSPNEPVFSMLEKLYRKSVKGSSYNPKCDNEPVDNTLEERYLESSEFPERNVRISPNDPVFSILEKIYRASVKGPSREPTCSREPVGNMLDGRYLEGSEVPEHYVRISPSAGISLTSNQTSVKGSNCDPKCENEPVNNILEECYFECSEVPENYVRVSPNAPVFSILEKLYRGSVKGSNYEPKSANGSDPNGQPVFTTSRNSVRESIHGPKHANESEGKILEGRYFEGSEVPEHYVQISPNGPAFNTLERFYRLSRKESSHDPKCANVPVEERYLVGSEVPERYVRISPNGSVFSILEKLNRDSFKESNHDPKQADEPVGSTLEERYLEGSKVPEQYIWISRKGSAFKTLDKLYRNSVKESNQGPKCADEPVGNILEERYLEGSDVPEHYVRISKNGSIFSIVEKLNRNSVKGSNPDTKRADEPVDTILEERYLEGSKAPEKYMRISRKGSAFNVLDKLYRNSVKGSNQDAKCTDEPVDTILEERYLEGSKVPEQYMWISRKGSAFNAFDKLYRSSVKDSNHDPKRGDEPVDSILEERYLKGSKVPEQYMWISRKGSAFKTLDKLYRNSVKGSDQDPKCADEPVGNILEERYLEGSEVPDHYVRISRNGSVFSIVEKLNRNSVKGSNNDPKLGDQPVDSILEGRYFEGSDFPEHYVRISRDGSVFSIGEKLNRTSFKGSNDDPKRADEPVDSILEGRYLEGSEIPGHHVGNPPKEPVFSILERLYRYSLKGSTYDPKCENELTGNISEER